jgi:diguanylate cyclase (GGDEF)-like protein
MPQMTLTVYATFLAQAVGGAVLALLLSHFHRQYHRGYLAHWMRSWWSLSIFHSAGALGLFLATQFEAAHPARIFVSVIIGIAGYLQISWLLFGAWELARRRPVRLSAERTILISAAVLGGATAALALVADDAPMRYFLRIGVKSLLGGTAFLIGAWAVLRSRRTRDFGFLMIGISFALYGIAQINYFAMSALFGLTGRFVVFSVYLGFVDLVLQGVMGLGMVTCLLEDEQEAAALATREIEHLAYHDALTGLPNRPLFMDRLTMAVNHASRHRQRLAVLFCDIDRFKEINDSLGHTFGDELLKSVSERLQRCVRAEDTVARFGGDEFTLLALKIEHLDDAAKIAHKVLDTMKIPFHIGEREIFATISIGVSVFPSDGHDPEALVKNADTAMYRAKERGRDNFQLYAPAMNARALEKLALENMLRRAMQQDEIVVFYQPLIDLEQNAVFAVEALVRWQHPELGLLSPAHFISTAEVSGLIIPLGDYVLREACRQVREWQRKYRRELAVSVNLSARQFQQAELVEKVGAALQAVGLAPHCLHLEITESNAMQNAENTIHTLRELKALGVRISMDDFGTGYSSLSYLKRFPIDTLKLDKSFVHDIASDPEDEAIATAVIAMAHSMSLKVVAEGVETDEQLNFLRQRRCDGVQGFYFSEPLSAERFDGFVKSRDDLFPQGARPLSADRQADI